jgi:hypothetical protein
MAIRSRFKLSLRTFAICAGVALIAGGLAQPAFAGAGGASFPEFPTAVTVGDSGLAASLTVVNFSDGNEVTGTVDVTDLKMLPSCSDTVAHCAGVLADPGTFTLGATAVGGAGTACGGRIFDVTLTNPTTGEVTFVPQDGQALTLQAPNLANDLDICRLNFTFDVEKVPNADARPGQAGIQTAVLASAFITHENGTVASAFGSDIVTFSPATGGPSVSLDKTSSPPSLPAPGGDFTFTLVITNTGTSPVAIASLHDDIYGDLATLGEPNNCDDLIEDVLQPQEAATCSYVGSFFGTPGSTQTDVSTVVVRDSQGLTATANDDATVALTGFGPPSVSLTLAADPPSLPAPGGSFDFEVGIQNTGPQALAITSLTDNVYGDLASLPEPNTCDDLIGDQIAAGASAFCTFSAPFTGVPGSSQTSVVTVVAVDPQARTATDSDDATVTITPGGPSGLAVDKSAQPFFRPVPGGEFTFTVSIANTGGSPATIVSITDDIYGDLATRADPNTCDDIVGVVLAAGVGTSCTFTVTFTGAAGDSETDVVTVVTDSASGVDDATIFITAPAETCNGVDDDSDGQVDEIFVDSDGDGIADCIDNDEDNDGTQDGSDNCPTTFNQDQADADADGIGDACDGNVPPVVNPPSAFTIEVDGQFEPPSGEWADITPVTYLNGDSKVYTSLDPAEEDIYLMYDVRTSSVPLPPGGEVGPVSFQIGGGSYFDVFIVQGGPDTNFGSHPATSDGGAGDEVRVLLNG